MSKEIQDVIPQALLEKAYVSNGDNNVEYAWQSEDAKRVLDLVTSGRIAVLGGEVWYPTGREIVVDMYFWETKREENEIWGNFIARCSAESKAMIDRYMNEIGDKRPYKVEPHFNFTAVDEETFDTLGEGL